MLKIIADHRERAVLEHGTDLPCDVEVKTLEIADYHVLYEEMPLILIERKTWKDLASSFKDGRKENVKHMIQYRQTMIDKNVNDILLVYLIEGKSHYKNNHIICGIKFICLSTHLDNLMLRDGVHIIYSDKAENTLMRIYNFAKNYSKLLDLPRLVESTAIKKVVDKEASLIILKILIWSKMSKLSYAISKIVVDKININNFISGNIVYDINELYKITYPSGVQVKKSMIDTMISLSGPNKITVNTQIKILTLFKGITKEKATEIINISDLYTINNMSLKSKEQLLKTIYGKNRNKLALDIDSIFYII